MSKDFYPADKGYLDEIKFILKRNVSIDAMNVLLTLINSHTNQQADERAMELLRFLRQRQHEGKPTFEVDFESWNDKISDKELYSLFKDSR